MRNLIQTNAAIKATTPRNAKFLIIRGRKVESVYLPENLTTTEAAAILLARQEITPDDKVIRA